MPSDLDDWDQGRLLGFEESAESVGIYAAGHLKQALWLARRCYQLSVDPTPVAYRTAIVAEHDKLLEAELLLAAGLAKQAYHLAKRARRIA